MVLAYYVVERFWSQQLCEGCRFAQARSNGVVKE